MNVTLPREQQKWLEAQVAAGQFTSIDEAMATAVADLMAMHADDFAWAEPYVISLGSSRTWSRCVRRSRVATFFRAKNTSSDSTPRAKIETLHAKSQDRSRLCAPDDAPGRRHRCRSRHPRPKPT